MVKRLRTIASLVTVAAATWAITTATQAQSVIPTYAFVRDTSGQVWIIGKGARVAVPLYPATDEQIAAVSWTGLWMVPKEDGTGIEPVTTRPDWATGGDITVVPTAQLNPTVVPTATTAPAASEDPVKLTGERAQNTKPFNLKGGNYTARWETRLIGQASSCVAYAHLYRVDPKRQIDQIMSGVSLNRESNRSESGETQIYGVTAGQYYLDVNASACSWSVTISPQQ